MTKNSKLLQRKKSFIQLQLLILRPPSKVQEKPSALKSEHPALQNMKFLNFFYFLWVIFALLDPDLADQNQSGPYPDRIQIHNTALLQVKGLPLASSGDGGNCNKNHDLLTYSKPMTWDGFFSH
jgi:hypothetical protein